MSIPTAEFHHVGKPGTLDYICRKYFNQTGHGDCPFKKCCTISNVHPDEGVTGTSVRYIGADILDAMAEEIRSTKEEAV
jgi:hypothetical protein